MAIGRHHRGARAGVVAALLAIAVVPAFPGRAAGGQSLSELKARMKSIQADLDAAAAKVSRLYDQNHRLEDEIADVKARRERLNKRTASLQDEVIARADELYRSGGTEMMEILFTSETFTELSTRAELLSRVSMTDSSVFVKMARTQKELARLDRELAADQERLKQAREQTLRERDRLLELLRDVSSDYRELKRKLAAEAAAAVQVSQPPSAPDVPTAPLVPATNGMVCPVAGPNSFVDSWGSPRSGGRSHQGVDIMADYGTPIVAVTNGTITYAGWSDLGGNTLYLTGDDGHGYYYMHNQANYVNGGRVSAGQQIAAVGDSGNATGVPHLHWEYHPGGGSAVNPYPLAKSLCG
ncbi:MAG: peptidoglycan DD-metalloendopeptidase family protein [Actinobacteria bacterium]|nr:peptidoglycan DD-metalloendopeptidase family protein [Actinomycetota bacterium]